MMELIQNLAHEKQLIVLNIFKYEYCVNKSCDMSQQQYNNTFIRLVLNYIHEREKTYIYIFICT